MATQHNNDDLDELLESALDGFRSKNSNPSSSESSSAAPTPTLGQGLGLGLPELRPKGKKEKASKSKPKILEELNQHTIQTVEELSSSNTEDAMAEQLVENLVKQLGELGNPQDIMDTMMRQLVSKDILHEPMKVFCERYPQWLETNKSSLSSDEYNRYMRQYECAMELCALYENNPDDFDKIVDIMHNMQSCGQPPNDLLQEFSPETPPGADESALLSEVLKELEQGVGPNKECSIM